MIMCPLTQRFQIWAAIALVAAFSHAATAVECSREEKARAKPHFETGAKAFRIGELEKAADEFKAAYEACASPLFLYNLGQTYRQLKRIEKAIYSYKQYLSATPPDDERRDEVVALVAKLEKQLADEQRVAAAPAAPPPPSADSTRAASAGPPTPPAANLSIHENRKSEPTAEHRRPAYKQWWLWTIVGVVVVGAGVGIGLGVSQANKQPYFAPGVTF